MSEPTIFVAEEAPVVEAPRPRRVARKQKEEEEELPSEASEEVKAPEQAPRIFEETPVNREDLKPATVKRIRKGVPGPRSPAQEAALIKARNTRMQNAAARKAEKPEQPSREDDLKAILERLRLMEKKLAERDELPKMLPKLTRQRAGVAQSCAASGDSTEEEIERRVAALREELSDEEEEEPQRRAGPAARTTRIRTRTQSPPRPRSPSIFRPPPSNTSIFRSSPDNYPSLFR